MVSQYAEAETLAASMKAPTLSDHVATHYPELTMVQAKVRIARNTIKFAQWCTKATVSTNSHSQAQLVFPNGLSVVFETNVDDSIGDGPFIFCETLHGGDLNRHTTSDEFYLWVNKYF